MWFPVTSGEHGASKKKLPAGQASLVEINVAGTLVRFSSKKGKGRGFIRRDDTGAEVKVYLSEFNDLNIGRPKKGTQLLFDIEQRMRNRGPEVVAANLRFRVM